MIFFSSVYRANAEVTSCFDNGTSATWPTFVRCAGNEDSLKNCGTDIEVGSQQCNVLKVLCSDEKISNTGELFLRFDESG